MLHRRHGHLCLPPGTGHDWILPKRPKRQTLPDRLSVLGRKSRGCRQVRWHRRIQLCCISTQRTGDDEERWPEDRKSALWAEIKSEVLDCLDETSEGVFMQRLYDFSHDGFSFQDWEYRSKEYSHRFLWCCHALEWAIKTYDAYKNEQKNADYPEYPAMEAPAP